MTKKGADVEIRQNVWVISTPLFGEDGELILFQNLFLTLIFRLFRKLNFNLIL